MRQKPPVEVFDAPTDVSGVSRDLSCKPGKEATRLGGRADPVSEMLVYQPRRAVSEVVCGRAAAINSAAQPRQKLTPRGEDAANTPA